MIYAIFDVIRMVIGLVLDIITLPFRALIALLGGAEFEFQRFSRRHEEPGAIRDMGARRRLLATHFRESAQSGQTPDSPCR